VGQGGGPKDKGSHLADVIKDQNSKTNAGGRRKKSDRKGRLVKGRGKKTGEDFGGATRRKEDKKKSSQSGEDRRGKSFRLKLEKKGINKPVSILTLFKIVKRVRQCFFTCTFISEGSGRRDGRKASWRAGLAGRCGKI